MKVFVSAKVVIYKGPWLSILMKYLNFTVNLSDKPIYIFALLLLWQVCDFQQAHAQGTQVEFGQSRVQYKDFTWSYYETDKFITYFYLGGQDIGKYVIQFAENEVEKIENTLEYRINKRIEILVYNDLSDLNQTNIGMGQENYNIGGVTKIIENKVFVYFNGNHKHLERQIRQGIAQVFLNHMMFGGNLQEVLQNAVLLNLPEWFTLGLVAYLGQGWSVELDDKLRDGILSGRYTRFNKLRGEDAKFAGHAMWHYVEQKYGKSAVPNLLYLTRINRSLESGFLFVLGGSVKNIVSEWYDYYYAQYIKELENKDLLADSSRIVKKARKRKEHYQVKLSADGERLAYVSNYLGAYKVHILNYSNKQTKKVLRGGIKTTTLVTDYSYPLLSWSPDGKTLAVIYEKRDKLYLLFYNTESNDKIVSRITKFQQINDFSFTADPRKLVMSAVQRGQCDIYTYYIPTTLLEQITNDYHDDLDVSYIEAGGRKGYIFRSNRLDTELKENRVDSVMTGDNFDLFFYDLNSRTNQLLRVTSTKHFEESDPLQFDEEHFTFLGDNNGIKNRYAGYFTSVFAGYDTLIYFPDSIVTNPEWNVDSVITDANPVDSVVIRELFKDTAITFPITNLSSNIVEHDISPVLGKSIDMVYENSRYEFYINELSKEVRGREVDKLDNTFFRDYTAKQLLREKAFEKEKKGIQIDMKGESQKADTASAVIDYFFQSDFNTSPEIDVIEYLEQDEVIAQESVFQFSRVAPYRVKFSTDYVTTQLDNSIIMTRYEKFTPGVPAFNNPPLGAMINLGISDLFEDYRIIGGFRLPFDFNGTEYFIAYENFKKRLDKKLMYYRRVDKQVYAEVVPFYNIPISQVNLAVETKVKTNYLELRLNYPIDVIRSFRWFLAYRNDNYVFQSKDDFSLGIPNYAENWLFAKLEFVHDNTIRIGLNLLEGLRFKFYGEIHKQFDIRKTSIANLDVKLPHFNNAYLGVFGFDIRHYQKLHRQLIWANRLAWGSSVGTRKLIYYLGGVDSWMGAKFDNETPVSEDNNYAFQTLATNMRGFDQNVRNGNSYMVLNSEIRFPVFTYLINSNIKSEFVKNFQIIGFTDIGTAWEGFNPYDERNPLFTSTIGQDPVSVEVEYFKNPVVVGYGFGLRSSLFGYFIRMDVAWGNDSGIKTDKPKLYFSLSLDF